MLVHVSQKSKYPWDQNGSIQCTPLHSGRAQKRHTPVPLKSVSITLQEQRVQLAVGAAGNSQDSAQYILFSLSRELKPVSSESARGVATVVPTFNRR